MVSSKFILLTSLLQVFTLSIFCQEVALWPNFNKQDFQEQFGCNILCGKARQTKDQRTIWGGYQRSGLDTLLSGLFTDSRDGHAYKWVRIGSQTWMAENLAFLPSVSPSSIGSDTEMHYYVYGYEGASVLEAVESENYDVYGVLYNWPAALNSRISGSPFQFERRGACPEGWHLPSDDDWKVLEIHLGMTCLDACSTGWRFYRHVGGKLKEPDKTHWVRSNRRVTNISGFTALPAGFRNINGGYYNLGYYAYFWSSFEKGSRNAWHRVLYYRNLGVYRDLGFIPSFGFSVRCLKD